MTAWASTSQVVVVGRSRAQKLLSSTNTRPEIAACVSICDYQHDHHKGWKRPHGLKGMPALALTFNDETDPKLWEAPKARDAKDLIRYLERHKERFSGEPVGKATDGKRLLIHCWVGRNRSTAAAMVGFGMVLGPVPEVVERVKAATEHPSPQPNSLLVRLADAELGYEGKLAELLTGFYCHDD